MNKYVFFFYVLGFDSCVDIIAENEKEAVEKGINHPYVKLIRDSHPGKFSYDCVLKENVSRGGMIWLENLTNERLSEMRKQFRSNPYFA